MSRRFAFFLLLPALAGCGGDEPTRQDSASATPAQPSGEAPTTGASPFIGSMTVDPESGTLMIGTGLGLYRLRRDAKQAEAVEGELVTPDASGTISPNLVLRFTGPRTLVASGHPSAGSALPENLGLIRSDDGGEAWEPVSLLGEADLHALDARGDHVAGQPADEARLLVSDDGGRSFEERIPPAAPIDVDLDPANPERIVIATAEGVFVSSDAGATWRQRDVLTVETHIAWSEDGSLYRVEAGGSVNVSRDGGANWRETGNVDGSPSTATVDSRGRLYVALSGAVIKRSDDGGRSFSQVTRLSAP
jgi:hypothetical protein